ncbi:MAG: hypothetical protein QM639_17880 [Rhodocyclaceae bacterium]
MAALNDQEILDRIDHAIDGYAGNLNDLGSAIGMLVLGRRYGWRVVLLIHSPSTVRKYVRVLGLRSLRDVLPELGELAPRSQAWRKIDGTTNFWRVVRGQISGVRSTLVQREG